MVQHLLIVKTSISFGNTAFQPVHDFVMQPRHRGAARNQRYALGELSLSRKVVGATLREPYHIHHFCDPYQPRCLRLNLNFCDSAIFSLFTLCFSKSSHSA